VADIESKNLREYALIENIQREDLNPIELAIAYKELIEEYKITQDGLSEIIHKSRTQITNTIRLLSLSQQTKNYLVEGVLSQGHAKVLVGLEAKDEETIVNTILGQKLSVRETETLVKKLKSGEMVPTKKSKDNVNVSHELDHLHNSLKDFGLKSLIKSNAITIYFKNDEEVRTLLEKFN